MHVCATHTHTQKQACKLPSIFIPLKSTDRPKFQNHLFYFNMMMIGNQSNVSFSKGIAFVILNYMYVCEGYRHMLAVADGDHKRASGPLEVESQRAVSPLC